MSSILEALKKLEEEKAARRSVGNIAGKVTASSRRAQQKPAWIVPAAMGAIAVVAVIGTYAAMGGFSSRHGGTAASTTPVPVSPPPAPVTTASPPAAPVETAAAPRAALPSPVKAPRITTKSPSASAPATTVPATAAKRPAPSQPEVVEHATPSPSSTGVQFPTLSVSGIAWQKDNAARLAVVNGAPVAEGASVAGVRVEEIFPDRVRFSYRERSFEVFLGK